MVDKEVEYEEMMKSVADQLERSKLGNYVDLMQSPGRMIFLNLFAGIARGLGVAIGFTILGAILIYVLQKLVVLNLPIIGGFISEVVKIVQVNVK